MSHESHDEARTSDDPPSEHLSIREPPLVLVPVEVLEGQTLSESLVSFLAPAEVVVLGYHVIPEQTPAEQADVQFGDRARAAVDDIAAMFEEVGGSVETRVAFTHDRDKTLDRIAEEIGATAVLLPNPVSDVSEILVPIRGAIDVERLADLVATVRSDDGQVTLWSLTRTGAGEDESVGADALLDRAEATLLNRGVPADSLAVESDAVESPIRAVVDRSSEFDVIVMGEGERTLLTTVLGETTERIAEGAVAPVLVVRGRHEN